jgi:hypothetical protein
VEPARALDHAPRPALCAAALAAGALPGLLPGGAGAFDPLALAAWLALVAAPLGALGGAAALGRRGAAALERRTKGLPAWSPPLVWAALVLLAARGEIGIARLPAPGVAAAAVAGLWALGVGLGACCPARAWRTAALLALAALLLAHLPTGAGALARPWPPELAAQLLELSPLTFVLERGGLDWMRHPAVYDPLGAASIGPDLHRAASGVLAPALLAVVGCALVLASWSARRRTSPRQP